MSSVKCQCLIFLHHNAFLKKNGNSNYKRISFCVRKLQCKLIYLPLQVGFQLDLNSNPAYFKCVKHY